MRAKKDNSIILFTLLTLNFKKIMNKKEMKFYEAPAMDVVEVKLSGVLCASGQGDDLPGGGTGISDDDYE